MTNPHIHPDKTAAEGAGEEPAPEPDVSPEQLRIAELERERDEYLDHLRRLAADFDNYKKRQARLAEQQAAQAGKRILYALLPVLDDLERSVDALATAGADESLREGVELIARALRDVLIREGLAEIAPDGAAFDPREHEALLAHPTSEVAEGTVLSVVQAGWRLGEHVLRPARVVVATPEGGEQE
jgi:molecular chaperone GrpE